MLLTDLAEAAAMRQALSRALRRTGRARSSTPARRPRCCQPRRRLRGAAGRFDALAAVNRPGRANALLHRLERRALARAAVLLPWGSTRHCACPSELARDTRVVALPVAIDDRSEPSAHARAARGGVAGTRTRRGSSSSLEAWALAAPAGRRLVVTGIEAEAGRAYLRGRGVSEPAERRVGRHALAGRPPRADRARRVFVSASRNEDYGVAQLEALAAGALLVTAPSGGPYEALRLARRLEPALVAVERSPHGLAAALQAALELPERPAPSIASAPRAGRPVLA